MSLNLLAISAAFVHNHMRMFTPDACGTRERRQRTTHAPRIKHRAKVLKRPRGETSFAKLQMNPPFSAQRVINNTYGGEGA
jgi:hypothetical protein